MPSCPLLGLRARLPPSTRPCSAGPRSPSCDPEWCRSPSSHREVFGAVNLFSTGIMDTLGDLSSRTLCTTFLLWPAVRFGRCLVGHTVTS